MNQDATQIQLVLISHTNAGKTTLARTLLGADMGEVRDAAHVTTLSESHLLQATQAGDQLRLWDTPGFGDSVRLFKRLALSGNPIGWFLREVVDRFQDRPFWLSQQAMRTARDEADVVLYLVNAAEHPKDTGYLAPEMKILQWLAKPVVVLLNQMGPPRPHAQEQLEQQRWTDHLAEYPVVRKVLPMDAFARCWTHEQVFFEAIDAVLPPEKKTAYARLLEKWKRDNAQRFQAAMTLIARQLVGAARDAQSVHPGGTSFAGPLLKLVGMTKDSDARQVQKALDELVTRINAATATTTADLLRLYRLDPGSAATINDRINHGFVVRAPVDTGQAGVLGALLSGAATGLTADLMTGGLSFGAGALTGALVGALTFSGAAWAFNTTTDRNQSTLQLSDAFLRNMVVTALLRYLAVAHFGRGRGNFVEGEAPPFWQSEVEAVLADNEKTLSQAWQSARSASAPGTAIDALAASLHDMTSQILARLYPPASAAPNA
jgi:GTPase Era involved in 16S rRNA processing